MTQCNDKVMGNFHVGDTWIDIHGSAVTIVRAPEGAYQVMFVECERRKFSAFTCMPKDLCYKTKFLGTTERLAHMLEYYRKSSYFK